MILDFRSRWVREQGIDVGYSILIEPCRKSLDHPPEKLSSVQATAPEVIASLRRGIGRVRDVSNQQIACTVDRVEQVAQYKIQIALRVQGSIEFGKCQRTRANVCTNYSFTMIARQKCMHP